MTLPKNLSREHTLFYCQVPPEVQVVAERYCRKRSRKQQLNKSSGSADLIEDQVDGEGSKGEQQGEEEEEEDVAIDLYSSSCKRECLETFHEAGKDKAMDEVAKLYEMVKNMPEGPQKAHFMKRVCTVALIYLSS